MTTINLPVPLALELRDLLACEERFQHLAVAIDREMSGSRDVSFSISTALSRLTTTCCVCGRKRVCTRNTKVKQYCSSCKGTPWVCSECTRQGES